MPPGGTGSECRCWNESQPMTASSPLVKFILRRLLLIPVSILIITIALHAIILLEPVESRALLYFPETRRMDVPPETIQAILEKNIRERGLDDPLPVQYFRWLSNLLQGDWGWSPTFGEVLPALLARIPATIELMLYSVLLLIPLGLISGMIAGARHGRLPDSIIRLATFISTSIPPFILALLLLAVFYVSVRWFPPERLGGSDRSFVYSSCFHADPIPLGHSHTDYPSLHDRRAGQTVYRCSQGAGPYQETDAVAPRPPQRHHPQPDKQCAIGSLLGNGSLRG
jgi:hypothetical protein